ncbi:MAG: polysaccharide deacetylase family protein, partial [Clostridia bacterium]|nr:polysaccharide deacetylase family protein [Clostridia bacterium]
GGGEYSLAREIAAENGYKYVLWAWRTDSKDWACPDAESISQTVLSTVSEGDIVLLHDYVGGKSSTPQAVAQIIPRLLAEGYSLDTVSGLLSRGSTRSNLQGE